MFYRTRHDLLLYCTDQDILWRMRILVTLTAAADKKDTTVNLKAPLVINTDTRKGCQVIVEDDYPIKFNVYEAVKGRKKAEE